MKHTPGPWRHSAVDPAQLGGMAYVWRELGGPTLAEVRPNDFTLANARLIAAAPDLLAALQDVIPDLRHYVATHGPGPDIRLISALHAIAKATGEQP